VVAPLQGAKSNVSVPDVARLATFSLRLRRIFEFQNRLLVKTAPLASRERRQPPFSRIVLLACLPGTPQDALGLAVDGNVRFDKMVVAVYVIGRAKLVNTQFERAAGV
jgi:hypothetical protein